MYGQHRDLTLLTPPFPSRRSSESPRFSPPVSRPYRSPPMTAQAAASPPPTRRFSRGPRRRVRISLTPLIDVVFILLIFFMLATSFVDDRAIEVEIGRAHV